MTAASHNNFLHTDSNSNISDTTNHHRDRHRNRHHNRNRHRHRYRRLQSNHHPHNPHHPLTASSSFSSSSPPIHSYRIVEDMLQEWWDYPLPEKNLLDFMEQVSIN